jgi:hypothetical protein
MSRAKRHNAGAEPPGNNCIVRQVVDERQADSGRLQRLVMRRVDGNLYPTLLHLSLPLRPIVEGYLRDVQQKYVIIFQGFRSSIISQRLNLIPHD